ncbi:alpha-L-fucosidase [Dyella tabacisoli]|uniref:alpha-L-fucosidase n=1 Tax=Dyella tabacisoli TaxID=2282381 RepID=A0A369ULU6_9GAMM|nr:alpha-L-fucosidase [Dyella tabacisoli]RDD81055.1 alpha-L-fucosidase [Dyella tabacisoli]
MSLQDRPASQRLAWICCLLLVSGVAKGTTVPATAPTAATITPGQADRRWRDAARPFEPARNALLQRAEAGAGQGPYRPDWISLQQYRAPAWYEDAKFGIFIHWGIYSVPAFANEWYPRNMYDRTSREYAHHVATYGSPARFGYKDFIPQFRAERFDPAAWARLFRDAGARYVVGVAEHSDGFAMYDSQLTRWTAVKMGPQRDLMADLGQAVHAAGLHFGLSLHHAEHDWFFDRGREIDADVNDPRYADLYGPAQQHRPADGDQDLAVDWTHVSQAWVDDWLAHAVELENYHPDLIYLDWWIGHASFRNALPKLLAYYYNAGAKRGGVVLNYKLNALPEGVATLDVERGQLDGIRSQHWQTDTTISNSSWCYVTDATFKSPTSIVHVLVDTVSKNGNLLLDIGPRPDGTIVDEEQTTLREIGAWLRVNGKAIYGSRPWRQFGEGPTQFVAGAFQEQKLKPYTAEDFRFTVQDNHLYAIALDWPTDGRSVIHAIHSDDGVRAVRLLGSAQTVKWSQQADGLHLTATDKPAGVAAYVYEIELAAKPIDSAH